MKAILCNSLFKKRLQHELMVFHWLSIYRFHRIEIDAPGSQDYKLWLSTLPVEASQDWQTMVDLSLSEEAKEPSFHAVYVEERPDSAWSKSRLSLGDAIEFLDLPYRLLLENGRSDRTFLLALSNERQKAFLEQRSSKEILEFEHCGGLGELTHRLELLRKQPRDSWRSSVVFDSDATAPGKPSGSSEKAREACLQGLQEIHNHQLSRRAIENYLPRKTLERYIGNDETKKLQLSSVFEDLGSDRRSHFNLKRGLKGDEKRLDRVAMNNLSPKVLDRLADGFGDHVWEAFLSVRETDFVSLDEKVAWQEVNAFIDELVERIR